MAVQEMMRGLVVDDTGEDSTLKASRRVSMETDEEENENKEENDDESDLSDGLSEEGDPKYTTAELAAIFLDFYIFLTTLHYDASDLKIPPPEGWNPEILPPTYVQTKSQYVLDLIRHLPYFTHHPERPKSCHIEYKSILFDYTTRDLWIEGINEMYVRDFSLWPSSDDPVNPAHVLFIAHGWESGGNTWRFNVLTGEMIIDFVRCDSSEGEDIKAFFEKYKRTYRDLKLVPCRGRISKSIFDVPESNREISEEEVLAQSMYGVDELGNDVRIDWGTDLDWQYVRQLYRGFGWPDAFGAEEASKAVNELMEMRKARYGKEWFEWEPSSDW